MQFRTEIFPATPPFSIAYQDTILSIGSCFAQNIGTLLQENKFETLSNPFGTVYNPIAILNLLERTQNYSTINPPFLDAHNLITRENLWFHYDFHSDFFGKTPEDLLEKIQLQLENTHNFLHKTSVLMLTFGTAFVHELKDSENDYKIVNNCHKQPAHNFQKRLLTIEEIVNTFEKFINAYPKNTEKPNIVLTISPIRHLKETLPLNSLSKALLRLACHHITGKFDKTYYFPSYELLIDDLRDYRFYTSNLLNPSEMAVQYVWEKFVATFFDENTQNLLQKWQKIYKALKHRPFHEKTEAHQQFVCKTLGQLKNLATLLPLEKEIQALEKQLLG